MSKPIQIFNEFNDFHQMANGVVRSHHKDVHVFAFEEVGAETSNPTPLFKTNFYQIGLFTNVEFKVSYFENEQVIQQRNAVVLFKPGQTISFSRAAPGVSGYAIMFKEHFVDFRLNNFNTLRDFSILHPDLHCVMFVDDNAFKELLELGERMLHEYKQIHLLKTENILKLYCQIIIEKINQLNARLVTPVQQSIYYKTTQEFKSLVFQNIHKTKNVSDYAAMLYITEKTLINHIKKITSTTPKDFINQVVAAESKAMLNNKASIEQVAKYFNFTDLAHFSHFFRKMTGESPRNFRKK